MMKNLGNWLGMLAMVLVFGMLVIGCGEESTNDPGTQNQGGNEQGGNDPGGDDPGGVTQNITLSLSPDPSGAGNIREFTLTVTGATWRASIGNQGMEVFVMILLDWTSQQGNITSSNFANVYNQTGVTVIRSSDTVIRVRIGTSGHNDFINYGIGHLSVKATQTAIASNYFADLSGNVTITRAAGSSSQALNFYGPNSPF